MEFKHVFGMSVGKAKRTSSEEYHIAIQAFDDSLRGLNAVTEEARIRCEKAGLACQEARMAYEREKAQPTPSQSLAHCPERDALEEQYDRAVIVYSDTVNSIRLPPRIPDEQKREEIKRARDVCNSTFKAIEDHERDHKCTPTGSARGQST